MNRVLSIILFYLCVRFSLCLKLEIKRPQKIPPKYFFLSKKGIYKHKNGNSTRSLKYQWLFYKNKKERDILESGYLYPFDHLEKKKKKFPSDPYVPSEEENEAEEEAQISNFFDSELNDNELNDNRFFSYDDNDAKQFFGKTEFSLPERIEEEREDGEYIVGDSTNDKSKITDKCYIENDTNEKGENIKEKKKDYMKENENKSSNIEEDKMVEQKEKSTNTQRELVKISVLFSEKNKIKAHIIKDQLHYLFHFCMDKVFNEIFHLYIIACNGENEDENEISVLFHNKQNVLINKKVIYSFSDLIDFSNSVKKTLQEKIDILDKKEMSDYVYLSKGEKKEIDKKRKKKKITDSSKNALQISIESSLKLIEKCNENMFKQKFELTLQDLKLAYNMLPCKYYGYFLANLCANISILSFYINDLQSAFDFALKSIKYEPKYFLSWKCLGDSYRSFRKFWQAKNVYDIAIYLGYVDTKGENFTEIMKALNDLTKKALENVYSLKDNMNNHFHVTVKKNIGIVINKNPDSIGGCYVSYIIEGSKAGKKNLHHGDQIVSLNNIITYGKPIDFCLKAFQKNDGIYDLIFFKGNIIELYGLKAYKYLMENNLFSLLFKDEKIDSFKKNETILFDMMGLGTFSEYNVAKKNS